MKLTADMSIGKNVPIEEHEAMARRGIIDFLFKQLLNSNFDFQITETDTPDYINYKSELYIHNEAEGKHLMTLFKKKWTL